MTRAKMAAASATGVAILASVAFMVTTSLSSVWPAPYGPGYSAPECEGKVCGFGFPVPATSCLFENGAAQGPVRCHPLDAKWEPFPAYPGNAVPADSNAYKHRYWGQCRQLDGVVKGYPPYYTGEPGGQYGPQAMKAACEANAFGTAATHDCEIHYDMGWTVRELYDWNASRFQGPISQPPAWQCYFDGTPTPTAAPTVVPTATQPPQPTPTTAPTTSPTPPVNPCPPGQCQSMFGCQPCSGVTPTPTPTPAPTLPPRCAEFSAAAMMVFKDIGNGKVSQTVLTQRLIRLRTEMIRKDGCIAVGIP